MTQIRFNEPPDPPVGDVWCTFCLMLAKNKLLSAHKADLEKLANDGRDDKVHWVPWDDKLFLMPGRYTGLSDMPQLGMLENLCWTHLAGIKMSKMSPLAQGGGRPPGLIRGQG